MSRLLHSCCLVLALAGCHALKGTPEPPAGAGAIAPAAAIVQPSPAQPPLQPPVDSSIEALLAEIEAAQPLEPAERQQLLDDLRQTEPQYWPLIARVWRAMLKRRAAETGVAACADPPSSGASAAAIHGNRPAEAFAAAPPSTPSAPAAQPGSTAAHTEPPTPAVAATPSLATAPPAEAPSAVAPATATAVEASAVLAEAEVLPVSHAEPIERGWRESLKQTIADLEKELTDDPQAPASRHASLRVLYLLDGRREQAMKALPVGSSAANAFWTSEMYGIALWLDEEQSPDEAQRATAARKQLGEAMVHLGALAEIQVRNLIFCTRVNSYGDVKPFRKYEFAPEQELLLYAEVENLGVERSAEGCRTRLRSSYQIFDASGRLVDKHEFGITEETCLNPRRDFFVPYRLWLPSRIYAGAHTLKLTVEDLIANKVGQSDIAFTVGESADSP